MYLITHQQPLETYQIFNPTCVLDGIYSLACIPDVDSSFQIYGLKRELENTARYYSVTVRGEGCDHVCELTANVPPSTICM